MCRLHNVQGFEAGSTCCTVTAVCLRFKGLPPPARCIYCVLLSLLPVAKNSVAALPDRDS